MTLEEYIQYRTGTTSIGLMVRNMFFKPFVSPSLRAFWQYWNPSWGYFLLFYCYKPLKAILPHWASLMLTFLVCGLLHDVIHIVPRVMRRGEFAFPFITVWFLIISAGILLTDYLQINFEKANPAFRVIFHLGFLIGTFILTRYIDLSLG